MDAPLCTRAAALIVKYDIHQGAKKPFLLPDSVVIDPENRDGLFPTALDIHELGEAVLGAGFSLEMTRGVCVQLPPGDKEREAILQYNREKCMTDKCFPEVLAQHVLYSGVGGNTMNTFLRCVAQNRQVPPDRLQNVVSATGHLSIGDLAAVDAAFAKAASDGFGWIILSSKMREEEPESLKVIQAAENMMGCVQRLASEVALINRMCHMISDKSSLATVGLDVLKKRLSHQAPHMTDHIEGIATFALKMGGEGSVHLKWLGELHERFVGGSKKIRGQFLWDLAHSVAVDLPRVKRAALFMQYTCPKESVKDRYCEWLSSAEVKAAVKKADWRNRALDCEQRMAGMQKKFEEDAEWKKLSYRDFQMLFARMEARVAQLLFGKKNPKETKHYASMDEIEAALGDEVQRILQPGQKPEATTAAPGLGRLKSSAVLMDAAGVVIDQAAMLKEKGIQVGVYVKRKVKDEDPRYAVVHECTLEGIVLMDPATRKTEQVAMADFSKDWVVVLDAAEVQDRGAIVNWADLGGRKSDDHTDQRCKADVLIAMDKVAEQLSKQPKPDLQVLTKPKLAVFAAADIAEGRLALCPLTHKSTVQVQGSSSKAPPQAVPVKTCGLPEEKSILLLPHFVIPKPDKPETAFIEPFWAVRRLPKDSGEAHKINCNIEHVPVSFCAVVSNNAWIERAPSKWSVEVPMLVNKRKIAKGEELLWEDTGMACKKRKEAPVFLKPAKGKAKASSQS